MSGESDLAILLGSLAPIVSPDDYVFVSRPTATYGDGAELSPIAVFREPEGLTLIVPKDRADAAGEHYDGAYRLISLGAYSALHAIGLTAAITAALSNRGISANVVAAFHHDHLFVPASQVDDAVAALVQLAGDSQS